MTKFNVTYELFNEDRDNEDAYDRGFISEDSILRDAIDDVTNVYSIECVESSEYPVISPRSVSVYSGRSGQSGDVETRTLHFPSSVTPSSRRRIAKLLGARI